ncbi:MULTISPECIES: sulfite exporter TauE/SafE family protein [unclassified Legionella]|uniref:sulfite exporter TauE/SafE family protein n=1 Tax=unclassified Legionella TaxID=2622702 RepID=UPI0010547C9D|nr:MULTISPECIES: sulfite exporter TauE/SafE family protein [unclassified Legionella]MDI9819538.1 sulfite exporter TauE/SafE family protein [Legionella sp. PL877]
MILTEIATSGTVYALIGAFAGLMSGILGIGGGVIVVPGLLFIFRHNPDFPTHIIMHMAAGTSLAVMLFTSQSSIRAHYKLNGILWSAYKRLWPGIVVGTILGALCADLLPTHWLKILFGLFLLFVAVKMLSGLHVTHPHRFPNTWINGLVSSLIGFKSGLLGVGGGTLIIPYLNYCGIEMRRIAAVSALCTMTVAILGTITCIITGSNEIDLPAYSTGYVYWPAVVCVAIPSTLFAPIGAKLTYIIPVKQLKFAFVAILLLTAVDLLA